VCVSSEYLDTVEIRIIKIDDTVNMELDTSMILGEGDIIFTGLDTTKRYFITITEQVKLFDFDSLGNVVLFDSIKTPTNFVNGYLNSFDCNFPDFSFIDSSILIYPSPSSSDVTIQISEAIAVDGEFEIYYLNGNNVIYVNSVEVVDGINNMIRSNIFDNTGNYYIVGRIFYRNYPYTTKTFSIVRE